MTSITTTSTSSSSSSNSNDGDSNNIANNGSISSIEAEYNKIKECNGWHMFYQEIRERCDREAKKRRFGTFESSKPQNRCLNRYRDVNPYDHSLIFLHRGDVDYINANLVKLERADRKYILTQGPLNDTVGHFWLMVWEQKTKAILMLNKLMEKKQVKCHQYWPDRKGPEYALKLNEVNLTVEYLRCEEYMNFCRRWFKLTDLESQQSREIIQFHYTTWPDFGIPSSPVAFLQFLKQVRDSGALDPDVGPAVVHCSAGIGRSGTFCLVDCCLVLFDKEGDNNVSVQDVLSELRRYRMGLIQTADQLYFSYQAIIKGITLLKDPTFLDYKEAPIISNEQDKQDQNQFNLDETPPPLPPRTHSLLPFAGVNSVGGLTLKVRSTQNKPLPKIPTSESFNDDLYAAEHNKNNKDALNNFINSEMNSDNHAYRPLPALPTATQQQNSLDRVHESDSDENELFEDDDSDDDDDNDDVANNDEQQRNNQDSNERNGNNVSAINALDRSSKDAAEKRNNSANDVKMMNGMQDGNQSGANSPENELKRRKRVERQSNIEQKVHEIKRKQRESEEGKQAAKKRRSLVKYIATGVIVGVICVYAYAKLT